MNQDGGKNAKRQVQSREWQPNLVDPLILVGEEHQRGGWAGAEAVEAAAGCQAAAGRPPLTTLLQPPRSRPPRQLLLPSLLPHHQPVAERVGKSRSSDIPRKRAEPVRKSLRFQFAPGRLSYPLYPLWQRSNPD